LPASAIDASIRGHNAERSNLLGTISKKSSREFILPDPWRFNSSESPQQFLPAQSVKANLFRHEAESAAG
jgi:hypothetical protein